MIKTNNPSESKEYDIVIIGAGPAGIMGAISASIFFKSLVKADFCKKNINTVIRKEQDYASGDNKSGDKSGDIKSEDSFSIQNPAVNSSCSFNICIIERNESAAKKLLLTGNGRCNYTADIEMEEMALAFGKKGRFFSEAFNEFSNRDLISFYEREGIEPEYEKSLENGTLIKVFPKNKNASSVRQCLIDKLQENKIHVYYGFRSEKILKVKNPKKTGEKYLFKIHPFTNYGFELSARNVIIATGGRTYPQTGSTGDGYKIAKDMGHSINRLLPCLVPIFSKDRDISLLAGVSVKHACLKILSGEKVIAKSSGSLLFTHKGLSGPSALSIGHEVYKLLSGDKQKTDAKDLLKISIDLAPDLDFENFKNEISGIFNANPKKELLTLLNIAFKNIPERLLDLVLTRCKLSKNLKFGNLSKIEMALVYNAIKNLEFKIDNSLHFDEAIVTQGGIPVKEINPRDMQSRLVEGLYFAGEIIELAGPEGGFNLQKSFSTGWLAGKSAAESLFYFKRQD